MKRFLKIVLCGFFTFFILYSCEKRQENQSVKESFLEGETTFLVDETLKPIVEDLVQIFEDRYEAKINIIAKSEADAVQSLLKDSARIVILPRQLTNKEINFFNNKGIYPKTTPFANDAIVLISNKKNTDTLITIDNLVNLTKGIPVSNFKGVVFDNSNSSTVRYMLELSKINELPKDRVFSFKTNDEVIQYINENDGMIGVVGLNYIYNPSPKMKAYIDNINVLSVQNKSNNQFYSPTQNNITERNYPLARELYIINCQGFDGLGMGFASFVTSDVGQRIVLKSGLVPLKFPPRKIITKQN